MLRSSIISLIAKTPTKGILKSTNRLPIPVVTRLSSTHSSNKEGHPSKAISKDGSTILCWHPEPEFPYEHTKPLPRDDSEMEAADSALKVQYIKDHQQRYNPDGPTSAQLEKMFYTTKHQWFPQPQRRYAKKNPPKDRDGI